MRANEWRAEGGGEVWAGWRGGGEECGAGATDTLGAQPT